MTCKDCVHEKVCKNAYSFKVTPPNVCGYFKNKADFVEVKQWLGHIQNDNHFPEVTKMVKAIALIEDYIEEPNSIAPDWLEALKLCLRLLREKVDG